MYRWQAVQAITAQRRVSIETAPPWIAAGAVACGMGSALTAGGPKQAAERVARLLASPR